MCKKTFCKIWGLCQLIFVSVLVKASDLVPRLSSIHFNEGEVKKLYLVVGRPSILLFPCNIVSFAKGTGGDMDATSKEQDPRELNLWLKNSKAEPTGLIVRCEQKTFVFDIIPSTRTHQDFVKILGSFGSPQFEEGQSKVVLSSKSTEASPNKLRIPKVKRIISSSKGIK